MALDDLLLAGLLWLVSRKPKAAPQVTFIPAPAPPSPAPRPAPTKTKPVIAPGAREVPWPTPKMTKPVPGQPLAFPASIPFAPMPYDLPEGYGGTSPPARMRTGPVQAERQTEERAIEAREKSPTRRDYWRPKLRGLTSSDIATAKSLLPQWKPGGFWFSGPRTYAGRRLYLAKVHSGNKRAIEVWEPVPPGGSAAAPSSTASATGRPMIRRGSSGAAVAEWQRIIGVDDDGKFGPATDAATRKWQADHGLDVDGIVGPKTWASAGK
jgi:hypothetical protein